MNGTVLSEAKDLLSASEILRSAQEGSRGEAAPRPSPFTPYPSLSSGMIWYVAAGSALGGVLRFLMVPWAQRYFAAGFPGGTLVVNVAGSLVIGLVLRLAGEQVLSTEARVFLTVGICGGFTTFSAFSAENLELLQAGQYGRTAIYVVASVLLSVAAAALGWLLGGLTTQFTRS
jgi:fluoride exporter